MPLNNTNVFFSTPFPHPSSAGPFEPSEKILTKTRLESGIWCNSGGHLGRKTSTITTDMVFVCCIFRTWSNNMDADKNKYILTWFHWSDLTNQRYILRELAMKMDPTNQEISWRLAGANGNRDFFTKFTWLWSNRASSPKSMRLSDSGFML